MTSTTTGLPDRYRPLDQVGADERTPTGVIRSWRAKDRVLNRDVAIRVHTPGGPAAHAWIARALTAGGLATPALAMVYDAAEGTDDAQAPNSAAYVVNEWIDGESLADRLKRGPLPQREARTIIRRLAEGVAEAHRVGLAVGGLTPEHVVLRPNGLVGLRAVPAASGTVQGDITALGALLEACLGGPQAVEAAGRGTRRGTGPGVPPDLAALVRRARSTEPGQGLSSVAAMVSLLNERPRTGGAVPADRTDSDSGWLRNLRRREEAVPRAGHTDDDAADVPPPPAADEPPAPTISVDSPVRLDPQTLPPVPPPRPLPPTGSYPVDEPWTRTSDHLDAVLPGRGYAHEGYGDEDYADEDYPDTGSTDIGETEEPGVRRRFAVVGISVAALAVVIALAWWFGSNVLSVAGSVDEVGGSTPQPSSSADAGSSSAAPAAGAPAAIVSAEVFDPEGDGQPENDDEVPNSYDNDPSTAWSTLTYRGSPAFGNLKPGVGILYDLGSDQNLAAVTLTTSTPGITVEVRTGGSPDGALDSYAVAASGTVDGTTDLTFAQPTTARFVLVWVTGLVETGDGFSGELAEVVVRTAG
ncbi:protein kinase family protein [Geodermatophilus sp. URMC 64]